MPQSGPSAKSVSYSSRCSSADCDAKSRSQRIEQDAQPCLRLNLVSVHDSPVKASAPSKVACWKLRVGKVASRYLECIRQLKRSFVTKRLSEIHPFLIEKLKRMRIEEGARVAPNRE